MCTQMRTAETCQSLMVLGDVHRQEGVEGGQSALTPSAVLIPDIDERDYRLTCTVTGIGAAWSQTDEVEGKFTRE